MKKSLSLILLAVLPFLLISCMTHDPYRTEVIDANSPTQTLLPCIWEEGSGDEFEHCEKQALIKGLADTLSEYQLAFAEFDDQGLLHNPDNVRKILKEYKNIVQQAALTDDGRQAIQKVILLVYVYGWHHNAQYGDSNVESFRELLYKAATYFNPAQVTENSRTQKVKVLGLYVGWRGESIETDYVNMLTFFDRKNTSHEVGTQGLTSLMLQVEDVMKVDVNGQYKKLEKDKIISIGHSFGAAALFSATGPLLAERAISTQRQAGIGNMEGFGDLTILMNPAFEAMKVLSLFQLYQNNCLPYGLNQPPRLITMSSQTDWPVKNGFPIGRRLGILFEEHSENKNLDYCQLLEVKMEESESIIQPSVKPIDSYYADIRSVTHFGPLVTHEMTMHTVPIGETLDCADLGFGDQASMEITNLPSHQRLDCPFVYQISACDQKLGRGIDADAIFQASGLEKLCENGKDNVLAIKSRNITHPANPFINMLVAEDIIPDHNQIWRDPVYQLFLSMIEMAEEERGLNEKLEQKQQDIINGATLVR